MPLFSHAAQWCKPVHSHSWKLYKVNQSDLKCDCHQLLPFLLCNMHQTHCERSGMLSETKGHHNSPQGIFPLDLFPFIWKWQLSRCVWLITYQLIFLWIYYYLSSYFRAVFTHLMPYCEDTLTESWFIWCTSCVIICLFLFLQACYHCMKCFVKEALLQNMNYETL